MSTKSFTVEQIISMWRAAEVVLGQGQAVKVFELTGGNWWGEWMDDNRTCLMENPHPGREIVPHAAGWQKRGFRERSNSDLLVAGLMV